jgi:hypothetical protein
MRAQLMNRCQKVSHYQSGALSDVLVDDGGGDDFQEVCIELKEHRFFCNAKTRLTKWLIKSTVTQGGSWEVEYPYCDIILK